MIGDPNTAMLAFLGAAMAGIVIIGVAVAIVVGLNQTKRTRRW
jgi:hypothetical protein